MNFTNLIRKNIGSIVAGFGFLLLCIVTFGDLGEVFAEGYWQNVQDNLLGISYISIGLTVIQIAIRQGVAEQALQKGLNTESTTSKYTEHKEIMARTIDKQIYLPYFLQVYNKKHTKLRKQEYLINNNYTSTKSMYASGNRKLIKQYERIRVNITPSSIKWSTVTVVYDKQNRIITLNEYRRRRIGEAVLSSFAAMIGTTFVTGGLFFSPSTEPLWQKFVKLFTYCVTIGLSVIFTVVKEYEKGAFGVPNELDEINQIWREFELWEVPQHIIDEVEELNKEEVVIDESTNENADTADCGTDIPKEPDEGESLQDSDSGVLVSLPDTDGSVLLSDGEEQCGECDGDTGIT